MTILTVHKEGKSLKYPRAPEMSVLTAIRLLFFVFLQLNPDGQ